MSMCTFIFVCGSLLCLYVYSLIHFHRIVKLLIHGFIISFMESSIHSSNWSWMHGLINFSSGSLTWCAFSHGILIYSVMENYLFVKNVIHSWKGSSIDLDPLAIYLFIYIYAPPPPSHTHREDHSSTRFYHSLALALCWFRLQIPPKTETKVSSDDIRSSRGGFIIDSNPKLNQYHPVKSFIHCRAPPEECGNTLNASGINET